MTIKRENVQTSAPHGDLLVAVRQLGTALDRFDEAAARALGVGRSDLRALNLLEHGPLAAGELGDRLGLTSGSVTVLVDRLAKAGFVTRQPGQTDRRTVHIHLEPATYAAFARVYAPCGHAVADLQASMSAQQLQAARLALRKLAATITDQERRLQSEDPHKIDT